MYIHIDTTETGVQFSLATLATGNNLLNRSTINGWLDVQKEVVRRLHARVWKPGDLLPSEAELAIEFGCARTTVNRALQAVADEGLLERRRKGGTRVVHHPERKASFSIPIIRLQIEQQGREYAYHMLSRRVVRPARAVRDLMQTEPDVSLLHIRSIHLADGLPYVLERRWVNTTIVPLAASADFKSQSPNEWLVENIPFSGGEMSLSAVRAEVDDASVLQCEANAPLFLVERLTRDSSGATITFVQLSYAPGYRMAIDL